MKLTRLINLLLHVTHVRRIAPQPVRPAVAKLCAMMELGDAMDTSILPRTLWDTTITVRFALEENLDATVMFWLCDPYRAIGVDDIFVYVAGHRLPVNSSECTALVKAFRSFKSNKQRKQREEDDAAMNQALAKIEEYKPVDRFNT
jgi:hypothetical protein